MDIDFYEKYLSLIENQDILRYNRYYVDKTAMIRVKKKCRAMPGKGEGA